MTSLLRPDPLKDEARDEAYEYFDKHIRKLHKRADGTVDPKAFGLEDNDYEGNKSDSINKSKPIVVLKEDENGRNELFFDLVKNIPLI